MERKLVIGLWEAALVSMMLWPASTVAQGSPTDIDDAGDVMLFDGPVPAMLYRPTKQDHYDSPTGLFRIHYDTTGSHSVYRPDEDSDPPDGVPDFVNRCAEYMDSAWASIVGEWAFDAPPDDGDAGGGWNLYDVYLHRLGSPSRIYGATFRESHSDQYPGRPGCYTSYILCDPNFEGAGYSDPTLPLKVATAHLFFHAVQYAYDAFARTWFKDNTATWMEDMIWDDVNDNYRHLPAFFDNPHLPLETENGDFERGAFVWSQFLFQRYGVGLVRETWERTAHDDPYEALDAELVERSSSIEEEFTEFAAWNYITAARDDSRHYEEGYAYPEIHILRDHDDIPSSPQFSGPDPQGPAACYIRFRPPDLPGSLKIRFDGSDGIQWACNVIVVDANNSYRFLEMDVDLEGNGEISIGDFRSHQEVVLIPVNLSRGALGGFIYWAELDSVTLLEPDADPTLPVDTRLVASYPNPFNSYCVVTFDVAHASTVNLALYDPSGRLIRPIMDEWKEPGTYDVALNGADLASGVYLLRLTTDGRESSRILSLVK